MLNLVPSLAGGVPVARFAGERGRIAKQGRATDVIPCTGTPLTEGTLSDPVVVGGGGGFNEILCRIGLER